MGKAPRYAPNEAAKAAKVRKWGLGSLAYIHGSVFPKAGASPFFLSGRGGAVWTTRRGSVDGVLGFRGLGFRVIGL